MSAEPKQNDFEGWAILELMGHRRLGGHVKTTELAGAGFFRIDVPTADGKDFATQFYPPSALYCLTPTTEETARAIAKREQPAPVHLYELQLEAKRPEEASSGEPWREAPDDPGQTDDDEDEYSLEDGEPS